MSYYSSTSECRERARNVLTADFPNTEIEEIQTAYKQLIDLRTHKTWSASDDEYELIQLIESWLVAADIMAHYGDPTDQDKATIMQDRAYSMLQSIIDESPTVETSEPDLEIASTEYLTFPLNEDVTNPRGRLKNPGYNTDVLDTF